MAIFRKEFFEPQLNLHAVVTFHQLLVVKLKPEMSDRKSLANPPKNDSTGVIDLPSIDNLNGLPSAQIDIQTVAISTEPNRRFPTNSEIPSEVAPVPPILGTDEQEDDLQSVLTAVAHTPPWLISLVVHMLVMIILAMLIVPNVLNNSISMEATFFDHLGDQLDQEISITNEPVEIQDPIFSPEILPEVTAPLLQPQELELSDEEEILTAPFESPNIGIALNGREPGMKETLLLAYGGDATTEAAVQKGLEWLKRNQNRDGTWSLKGPFSSGALGEDKTAATAMAMIAFQGAGHTHKSTTYGKTVRKGWQALKKMQRDNGDFWRGTIQHHRLYAQAQATIAACELYGMTKESMYRQPAQSAIDYAVKIQDRLGGWKYEPQFGSDTSVTGWFVMALQSAKMAGLNVPTSTLQNVSKYLDRASQSGGATYGYEPGSGPSYSMTAEGLLCRQYLGWKHDDARLQAGIRYLTALPNDWENRDVYYWYYATQTLHHMGGAVWENWNREMKQQLPTSQTQEGPERGSWSPEGDAWGTQGGRLYTTCLCLYMLEVYYRHLPIYENVFR